jgi:hypothetical protein
MPDTERSGRASRGRKALQIFSQHTRMMRENIDFLKVPMFSPERNPPDELSFDGKDSGHFCIRAKDAFRIENCGPCLDGKVYPTRIPNHYDFRVLIALRSRVHQCGETGKWISRFDTGQELLDAMGITATLNSKEIERISEAVIDWMGTVLIFRGLLHEKGKPIRKRRERIFQIISDAWIEQDEDGGNWQIEVTFNDAYISQSAEFFALFHYDTMQRLSPFAAALYRWMSGAMARPEGAMSIGLDKLSDQLGVADSSYARTPSQFRKRLNSAVTEINNTLPSKVARFEVGFRKAKGGNGHVANFMKIRVTDVFDEYDPD